jgi:hypothetical protein
MPTTVRLRAVLSCLVLSTLLLSHRSFALRGDSDLLGPSPGFPYWPLESAFYTNGTALPLNWCPAGSQVGTGNFDTDGRQDLYCFNNSTGEVKVALSVPTGFNDGSFKFQDQGAWLTNWCVGGDLFGVGSFGNTLNGLSSLWCHYYNLNGVGANTYVAVGLGSYDYVKGEGFDPTIVASRPFYCPTGYIFSTGDINGDLKTDLLCRSKTYSSGTVWASVQAHDGKSFGATLLQVSSFCLDDGTANHPPQFGIADFSGDGSPDLFCHTWDGNTTVVTTTKTQTGGFGAPYLATNQGQQFGVWQNGINKLLGTGDFNHDGFADLWVWNSQSGVAIGLNDRVGAGHLNNNGYWVNTPWCVNSGDVFLGNPGTDARYQDFNGDGFTDLACAHLGGIWDYSNVSVFLNAHGAAPMVDGTDWIDRFNGWCIDGSHVLTADVNNDGKTDVVCNDTASGGLYSGVTEPYTGLSSGGSVVTTPKVYVIYYGETGNGLVWTTLQQTITHTFLTNLSGSPYFSILNQRYSTNGLTISTALAWGGSAWHDYILTNGQKPINQAVIQQVVNDAIASKGWTMDGNSIVLVMAPFDAPFTDEGGYPNVCGYHHDAGTYSWAIIGNPGYATDTTSGPCKPTVNINGSPNDDVALDAMLSTVAHELFESITDKNGQGGGWGTTSGGLFQEEADLCSGVFGPLGYDGHGSFNVTMNGKDYLLQEMLVPINSSTGFCGLHN